MKDIFGFGNAARVSRVEKEIVPFLLKMSRLPKGTPARTILERADEKSELGALLSEARRDYLKGSGRKSLESCLDKAFSRVRSSKISRFLDALKIGIANNFDAAELVRRTASDLQEMETIDAKRSAALSIQKYTLISTGAFFVPFLLGATTSIIAIFSRMGPGLSSFGVSIPKSPAVLGASLLAYSLILPVVSSCFVSLGIEGKKESLPKYLLLMPAVALAMFLVGKSLLGG
jgi:hypothetical protein